MPISDMHFEGGIFSARQHGVVEAAEAEAWVEALRHSAASSPMPIVLLVDAREVESITPAAGLAFVRGSATPNVKVAVVVSASSSVTVRAQTISMMSERRSTHETHVFQSLEEAWRFARISAR